MREEYHGMTRVFVTGMGALSAPVSYTHLRAHETVLDLVCRLLLEKKKNNDQSTRVCVATRVLYKLQ